LEVELVLFSRAFIRKRMISLGTTASVAAISFASAQDPAKTHDVRYGMQYVADRQEEQRSRSKSSAVRRHQGAAEMARQRSNMAVTSGLGGNRGSNSAVLPQLSSIDGSLAHGGTTRL